jgi:hypothetical protein
VFTGRPPEPKSERAELARLVRRLQALTFELRELRRHAEPQPEQLRYERSREGFRHGLAEAPVQTARAA